MENKIESQENWNEIKVKLKQKFAKLTDSDVLLTKGKRDEMLVRLEIKLNKTKEELTAIIATIDGLLKQTKNGKR